MICVIRSSVMAAVCSQSNELKECVVLFSTRSPGSTVHFGRSSCEPPSCQQPVDVSGQALLVDTEVALCSSCRLCPPGTVCTCNSSLQLVSTTPRRLCARAGAQIGVLAKIESAASVDNLESILDAVDGAMVARGDLGAELPVEEVRWCFGCQNPLRFGFCFFTVIFIVLGFFLSFFPSIPNNRHLGSHAVRKLEDETAANVHCCCCAWPMPTYCQASGPACSGS